MKILSKVICMCMAMLLWHCDDTAKKKNSDKDTKVETTESTKKSGSSNMVLLEDNGIKIALPPNYKRTSLAEYQKFLESNYDKEILKYEKDRARKMRNRDGQFYVYLNKENASSVTVSVTNPLQIASDNPQPLLNMITSIHTESNKKTKREYEKITAGFSDNKMISIFKAVYKVMAPKAKAPIFEHSYIITNDDLSMHITMETKDDVNLDPYIEKIKF